MPCFPNRIPVVLFLASLTITAHAQERPSVSMACDGAMVTIVCGHSQGKARLVPEAGRCNFNDPTMRTRSGDEPYLAGYPNGTVFADPAAYTTRGAACYRIEGESYIAVIHATGAPAEGRECPKCQARDLYTIDGQLLPEINPAANTIARNGIRPVREVWLSVDE